MKILQNTFFSFLFLLVFIPTSYSQEKETRELTKAEGVDKLNALLSYINLVYVDEISNSNMVDNAIVGILEKLDPHSIYIPEKETNRMNEPLQGNFEGIGIQFNILNDTLTVVWPISGGPSEKLGIRAGDKILKIEGENVAGVSLKNRDVQNKLRGKKGTIVNVEIKRAGEKNLISYDITRDKIPIYSVDATYMASPDIGYIKINRFARTTMQEFHLALDSLKKKGANSLILDLRGNGGGYLNTAFKLADEFLPKDKMIVYTEGLRQNREEYKATSAGSFEKGKVVVLIDRGSASASEIVSGAIQDWDRGVVIGRRSFGKGLVQRQFDLPDGSEVRLTTARYYTPTGRSIQRSYSDGKKEYYKELERRFKKGELMEKDSIIFPDSLKYYTPNQRLVYGGGGIMPDIFIPLDTSMNSGYNRQLVRKGLYSQFILNYLDKNRKRMLKQYPTFDDYKKGYVLEESFLEKFFNHAEKKKVKKIEEDYEKSKQLIHVQLKALLAQNLYSNSAYFEIINVLSDSYHEAINILESKDYEKAYLEQNKY